MEMKCFLTSLDGTLEEILTLRVQEERRPRHSLSTELRRSA
jgi:hypothetical protein